MGDEPVLTRSKRFHAHIDHGGNLRTWWDTYPRR
jgi:hypothetical protein